MTAESIPNGKAKKNYEDLAKSILASANGKAKKNYEDLAKSILASAKAKAALNKVTEQTAKLLDADYQIEKIKAANYNEIKGETERQAKQPTFYRGGPKSPNQKYHQFTCFLLAAA